MACQNWSGRTTFYPGPFFHDIPLNGANYLTWKIQVRMALMKGLWGIVNGTEGPLARDAGEEKLAKFAARRDKALATTVIGDPDDPQVVRKKPADQYQRRGRKSSNSEVSCFHEAC